MSALLAECASAFLASWASGFRGLQLGRVCQLLVVASSPVKVCMRVRNFSASEHSVVACGGLVSNAGRPHMLSQIELYDA